MTLFGLPLASFAVLIGIPLAVIALQYWICWQIRSGRRE